MRKRYQFLSFFATICILTATGPSCALSIAQEPNSQPNANNEQARPRRQGFSRGPQIKVDPPADAIKVEKVPPIDQNGNFQVSTTGPWVDVPVLQVDEGVPRGNLTTFVMKSEDTKVYPGVRGPYERQVWVYVPAGYTPGTELPFMVNHDGSEKSNMQATLIAVLDNYIAQKRLPMMAAVFIANGGGDGPRSQRGLEYDTVSGAYADFIESEVLPLVKQNANVSLTNDPNGRGVLGASSGAAAALSMAWFRPDLYRRVISYSGTFVNQMPSDIAPRGAWEYHASFIPNSDKKPLRIWLQVGSRDNGATSSEEGLHNWVLANNRMADALKAKDYDYQYLWAEDAGHVEKGLIRQTLGAAMEWTWKTYEAK